MSPQAPSLTVPARGEGAYAFNFYLTNLYDLRTDPLGLMAGLEEVSRDALEAAVISDGFDELAVALGGTTLEELATGYRAFARAHPHLYRLMTGGPLDRDLLVPGAEERAAFPAVRATGGDRDAARALWAFAGV